jgi:hypothetical protein
MSGDFDPNGPAMPAPEGQVQNLDNPPNGNDAVVAVYSVCLVITTAFVATRIYAKFIYLNSPRIVDCKSIFSRPCGAPVAISVSDLSTDLIVPTFVRDSLRIVGCDQLPDQNTMIGPVHSALCLLVPHQWHHRKLRAHVEFSSQRFGAFLSGQCSNSFTLRRLVDQLPRMDSTDCFYMRLS